MTRQSISFTHPNNDWLVSQVSSLEFKNKSDVINDLVRKARAHEREVEMIRRKLIQAEKSGFIVQDKDEILLEIKQDLSVGKKL